MGLPDNRDPFFFHQSAFSEFAQCLQWVLIVPAPSPFVSAALDSSDFYLTKILQTFKDDPNKEHHRNFVNFIKSTLKELAAYVKQFHTTGLVWNPSGIPYSQFQPSMLTAGASSSSNSQNVSDEDKLAALIDRLELAAMKMSPQEDEKGVHPSIADFDALIEESVVPFQNACKAIGGDVAHLGDLLGRAFVELRGFVVRARECQRPSDDELGLSAGTLCGIVQEAGGLCNARDPMFAHFQSFAEFVGCVQWVLVYPAPGPFVSSSLESADFYMNKVLKSHKDDVNAQAHKDFVKFMKQINASLVDYIKKHHTTGLNWKK